MGRYEGDFLIRMPEKGNFLLQSSRKWNCYGATSEMVKDNALTKAGEEKRDELLKKLTAKIGRTIASTNLKTVGELISVEVSFTSAGYTPRSSYTFFHGTGEIRCLDKKGKPTRKKVALDKMLDVDDFTAAIEKFAVYVRSIKDPLKAYYDQP